MKKGNGNILYVILFGFLMAFLFLPLLQQQFHFFEFKKLTGYQQPAPKPVFSMETYKNGDFQYDLEQYVSENIGFREPIIRMYNQYVYDFYKKTYNKDVAIEKDGWLYHTFGVNQHFGNMGKTLHHSNEEFRDAIDLETRNLMKLRAILKEYGVELLVFTLPNKPDLYPQHLKPRPFADTTFNGPSHFEHIMTETGVPYINMNRWLKQVQDTTRFSLFPQKGSHWAAGAPLAVDTLLGYMEHLLEQPLVRLDFGTPYPVKYVPNEDKDLEMLLNLNRPLAEAPVYEYPVSLNIKEGAIYPTVLFVGTSFYWYLTYRAPFEALFESRDFLYYGNLYYSDNEQVSEPIKDRDFLFDLLSHDVIVYFKSGPQLYEDGFAFSGRALQQLCIDDDRTYQKVKEIADSLMAAEHADTSQTGDYQYLASMRLLKNPELFEELRGNAIPTARNPKIGKALLKRDICSDIRRKALLEVKAYQDSVGLAGLLDIEAELASKGTKSLTDNLSLTAYDFFYVETKVVMDSLRHSSKVMDSLTHPYGNQKLDKLLFEAAIHTIERKIALGNYDDDPVAAKAIEIQRFISQMNNPTSLANLAGKAKQQGKRIEKTARDDAEWIYRNIGEHRPFSRDEMIGVLKQFDVEYQLRNSPESWARILEKSQNLGKPAAFVLMDDVNYILDNMRP